MSTRARTATVAALTAVAALAVVAPATPSTAGGAGSTRHAATLEFDNRAVGKLTPSGSSMQLVDYTKDTYYDRVLGNRSAADALSVDGSPCAAGGKTPTGLSVFGEETTWANMAVDQPTGARVEISCVVDGVHHRYHWGNRKSDQYTYVLPSSNCVSLIRTTTTTFLLSAAADCEAQDQVLDSRGRQTGSSERSIPFTATLTVPTLK